MTDKDRKKSIHALCCEREYSEYIDIDGGVHIMNGPWGVVLREWYLRFDKFMEMILEYS